MEPVEIPMFVHDVAFVMNRFRELRQSGLSNSEIENRIRQTDLLAEFTEQCHCIDVNDAAVGAFSAADRNELIHRVAEVYRHHGRDELIQRFVALLHEQDFECTTRLSMLDGDVADFHMRSKLVRSETLSVVISAVTNITEYSEARKELLAREKKLKQAIEAAQVGICHLSRSGHFEFDPVCHAMLGYAAGELNGQIQVLNDLIHPDDAENGARLRRELFEGKRKQVDNTARFRSANGCYRWICYRGKVLENDEKGQPSVIAGSMRDVDDEVTSRQLLDLESRVMHQLAEGTDLHTSLSMLTLGIEEIWDNVRCAINFYSDSSGTLHHGVSPSLGVEFAEGVEGVPVKDLPYICGVAIKTGEFTCAPDFEKEPPGFLEALPFFVPLGIRGCWSMPIITGGETRGTLCICVLIPRTPSENQQRQLERLAHTAGLLIEADRQRKLNNELDAKVQTRDRLEGLGRLAGGIAHDFNNLLTVILGNAEILERQQQTPGESVTKIKTATKLAAELCHRMLTYAGQTSQHSSSFDIADLTREIVELIRSSCIDNVQFVVETNERLPAFVGDRATISQLILNLVTNAVEAIQPPGVVTISIGTANVSQEDIDRLYFAHDMSPGSHVQILVADTGSGIDPDFVAHIFDPFYSTKPEGRGMGLATVFGAVQRHRGGISVDSAQGRTTFRVWLPVASSFPESLQGKTTRVDAAHEKQQERQQEKQRIAVIDDETEVRNAVVRMLEHHGYLAFGVASGEEAIEDLSIFRDCDGVLLDQRMHGVNGTEVYQVLRREFPTLPVCFMSGFVSVRDVVEIVRSDKHCVQIDKPFAMDKMLDAIRSIVQVKKTHAN